jgi:hypothetical protein
MAESIVSYTGPSSPESDPAQSYPAKASLVNSFMSSAKGSTGARIGSKLEHVVIEQGASEKREVIGDWVLSRSEELKNCPPPSEDKKPNVLDGT